jgi:hypothetical protein
MNASDALNREDADAHIGHQQRDPARRLIGSGLCIGATAVRRMSAGLPAPRRQAARCERPHAFGLSQSAAIESNRSRSNRDLYCDPSTRAHDLLLSQPRWDLTTTRQ